MAYGYVALTILFTVCGQLLLKWQIEQYGQLPAGWFDKLTFTLALFLNPWILLGFVSAFLAALFWMAALTRLEISVAYPFMGLAFVFVLLFSIVFLGEPLSVNKVLGTFLVCSGLVLLAR